MHEIQSMSTEAPRYNAVHFSPPCYIGDFLFSILPALFTVHDHALYSALTLVGTVNHCQSTSSISHLCHSMVRIQFDQGSPVHERSVKTLYEMQRIIVLFLWIVRRQI